jgi:hypothetical protein
MTPALADYAGQGSQAAKTLQSSVAPLLWRAQGYAATGNLGMAALTTQQAIQNQRGGEQNASHASSNRDGRGVADSSSSGSSSTNGSKGPQGPQIQHMDATPDPTQALVTTPDDSSAKLQDALNQQLATATKGASDSVNSLVHDSGGGDNIDGLLRQIKAAGQDQLVQMQEAFAVELAKNPGADKTSDSGSKKKNGDHSGGIASLPSGGEQGATPRGNLPAAFSGGGGYSTMASQGKVNGNGPNISSLLGSQVVDLRTGPRSQ